MMTCESPMRDDLAITISSQATATMAPPECALVLTQATVFMPERFLTMSAIPIELVTSPPGVSSSKMMTVAPLARASAMRR